MKILPCDIFFNKKVAKLKMINEKAGRMLVPGLFVCHL